MSKNILQALGKIDAALGGNTDDAANVIDALDQISERAGSLKDSVDNINSMELKICESGEYDAETGVPTIEDPVKGTFYLTPAKNEEDNNVFNEYYVNDDGQWEMFGSASINVNDLFDLSDRMAKGVNDNGVIINGAIIEGEINDERLKNKALGINSHAEGSNTTASNVQAHAEGGGTTASGLQSHAEGMDTTASGEKSHAEGGWTIANHRSQHVFGELNIADPSSEPANNKGTYIEIVGNGTTFNARSNARTLDWDGNETLAGSLTLGKGTADEVTITAATLKALLSTISS